MQQGIRVRLVGRVQGVGFRAFVVEEATKLGLLGHVWNDSDGSVVVEAFGENVTLALFTSIVAQGPEMAKVDHMDSVLIPWDDSRTSFEISYPA